MILALESSCDETAVALFDPARGIVGEWIHSQIALHENYGGVVPDLASREHLRNFPKLLERARATEDFLKVRQVAVTHGPGLAGCLAIGLSTAKAVALADKLPLAGVNHLRAHVFSSFISLHAESPADFEKNFADKLPHLALVVSGGNTLLAELGEDRMIRVISTTRDDAAGEALDKGAKLLGLGYPGGPLIEKLAQGGQAAAFDFPKGLSARDNLDFSFSGLKTSLRYLLEKLPPETIQARMNDICASYQQAVVDALVRKTRSAIERNVYRSVGLSGGVANNKLLRASLENLAKKNDLCFLAAQPKHTGDNAGMIAFAAHIDPLVKFSGENAVRLRIAPALDVTAV